MFLETVTEVVGRRRADLRPRGKLHGRAAAPRARPGNLAAEQQIEVDLRHMR